MILFIRMPVGPTVAIAFPSIPEKWREFPKQELPQIGCGALIGPPCRGLGLRGKTGGFQLVFLGGNHFFVIVLGAEE